ncbi:MAG: 4-hydroxy-tetrahydrodipicolinate synthase [Myxococcales bacterium]|nr:4-hydroxy-tetrahydrodipicolinate synthase [Myxococcales bacterium]
MIGANDLRGCYPAIITPMTSGGEAVDFAGLERLVHTLLDAGVPGIAFAGTTGQSATLTYDEHVQVVQRGAEFARAYAKTLGREVLVIGAAGSNATHEALVLCERILAEGRVDAMLQVTGYYNNPPQEGLFKHFWAVADLAAEHECATILYNVPSRTCSNLEPKTVAKLAQHPAIIGIKEASGSLAQIQEILDGTSRETFAVLSGEDHLVSDVLLRGGTGVIAASGNMWPAQFQRLCELGLAGKHDAAEELQRALIPCAKAVFSAKNPIPLHFMLKSDLRLPLVGVEELNETDRLRVYAAVETALAIKTFPHCQ